MRHFLASGPVTARSLGMGKLPPAAGLVASPGITLGAAARARRAVTGAIDLAAVATAADQHLDATARAHQQTGRGRPAVAGAADAPWTNLTIDGILAPHACPARVWGTASSVTAKFRSAPCLPLDTGKPLPRHQPPRQHAGATRRKLNPTP